MKLRLIAAGIAAFGLSAGMALAQTAPANPANPPQPPPANKPVLSYAIGFDLGKDLVNPGMDVDLNAVIKGLQDGYAKRAPQYPTEQMEGQLVALQMRMVAQARAEYERQTSENKAASTAFLAQNRTKPGITVLPNGIQYRVIEPGSGAKPTADSTVQVHFRGSVSSGREFANTLATQDAQPSTHVVKEFPVPGIREVLPLMATGARWEVFLPPEQGFGDNPRSPVGPGQALVFEVRLVSVK